MRGQAAKPADPRAMPANRDREAAHTPRFICGEMLKRLARWLRAGLETWPRTALAS